MGRIPLYYEAKLIAILYLALPQTRGALKLFQDHQDKLDLLYKQAIEQLNKIQAVMCLRPSPYMHYKHYIYVCYCIFISYLYIDICRFSKR